MTIENMSALAMNRAPLSGGNVAGQSAFPQQAQRELPKIEFKTPLKPITDALKSAVGEANKLLEHIRPDIKFVIDDATKDVVVMLVEPGTGEVISRYPTEQALAISNAIVESQARVAKERVEFNNSSNALLGLFVEQKT